MKQFIKTNLYEQEPINFNSSFSRGSHAALYVDKKNASSQISH